MSSRGTDFFISHAGRDTAWAEWLAWQLQEAGYTHCGSPEIVEDFLCRVSVERGGLVVDR